MSAVVVPEEVLEALRQIKVQEAAHEAWKASLKPVGRSAVVDGWTREAAIEEHYENTVRRARKAAGEIAQRVAGWDNMLATTYIMQGMEEVRR